MLDSKAYKPEFGFVIKFTFLKLRPSSPLFYLFIFTFKQSRPENKIEK